MSDWISVDDRLPKTTGMVLATDCDTVLSFAYIKYLKGGGKWGIGGDGITHWMPLPEPPESVK
jgi:hypothetical protein